MQSFTKYLDQIKDNIDLTQIKESLGNHVNVGGENLTKMKESL